MSVFEYIQTYTPRKPTVKQAINAKIKVLKELCVVDNKNADTIRKQLQRAIDAHPNMDYEHVLDQVAHTLIAKKLNT